MTSILAGIAGGIAGYLAVTAVANLEDVQFYTFRKWATGKDAVSEMIEHPADEWVYRTLVMMPVILGALSGVQISKRLKKKSTH